jgi:uncharacterized protein
MANHETTPSAANSDPVAVSAPPRRLISLDAIRGFAVMGILLMNIIAFAMPQGAYVSPAAYGGTSLPDLILWSVMSVLVDGKMRGLFSMLFGASMLLVYERAQAANGDGSRVHKWRMLWLLILGAVHYYFIWFGDILTLYALCGLAGMMLLLLDEAQLRRTAIWLMIFSLAVNGLMFAGIWIFKMVAAATGADPALVASYTELMTEIGSSDPAINRAEIALFQGGYGQIVYDRLTDGVFDPLIQFISSAPETLGLMAIGMLLFRNGFLTGAWESARYKKALWRAYAIGLPPSIALTGWSWASGFDPLVTLGNMVAWSLPFRIAVMIGHAALFMLIIKRFAGSAMMARVVAAGQAAFSNYLGTSILMTTLFYGYGLGWFGTLTRTQAYLVVPCVWLLMLLWSKPWLDRYRYGPLEWLWRSLARGEMQRMLR